MQTAPNNPERANTDGALAQGSPTLGFAAADSERLAYAGASHVLDKLALAWVLIGLFPQVIFFGGVHAPFAFSFQALSCALALAVLWNSGAALWNWVRASSWPTQASIYSTMAVLVYIIAQGLLFQALRVSHPVLGSAGQLADLEAYRNALLALIAFVASGTVLLWMMVVRGKRDTIVRCINFACILAAAVAITQWLSDNGKLLWLIEPHQVLVSPRARWPFVNPDHLAAFLTPGLFLIFQGVRARQTELWRIVIERQRNRSLFDLFTQNPRIQARAVAGVLWSLGLLLVLCAQLATVSRAGMIGLCAGILAFLCMEFLSRAAPEGQAASTTPLGFMQESRRERRGRKDRQNFRLTLGAPMLSALLRYAALVFCLALAGFVFSGRGTELLRDRLEYGLISSRDDVRWAMYSDSLRMWSDAPWLGVGLGNWGARYWSYMDPKLAGINPVYLHSDVVQSVVELGVIGTLPILLGVFGLLGWGVQFWRSARGQERTLHQALWCALLALSVSASLDFPLRIPAISFSLAIYLSLILSLSPLSIGSASRQGQVRPRQ